MRQADDDLYRVFGEHCCAGKAPTYQPPDGGGQVCVEVMISRDVTVAGADGIFRPVQFLAELRMHQVRGRRGGLLTVEAGRFKLDDQLDSDGLVEKWSLIKLG